MVVTAWAVAAWMSPLASQTSEDDIVILPEFVVDEPNTVGYLQTNSNTGTRLSENIKDLPMPVEIITGAFIEDTGATTIEEALQFTAGLQTDITSAQAGENPGASETSFRLRGFVSESVLRNGFKRLGSTDTVNVSQVDVARGPNALLYGIGNFGGVVNYVTRRPLGEPRYSATAAVGSWDFYRTTFSASGPILKDRVGYAFDWFFQDQGNWYDGFSQERYGYATVLEFKPFDGTTLVVEWEYIHEDTTSPENPYGQSLRQGIGIQPEDPIVDQSVYPTRGPSSPDGTPGSVTNQGLYTYPSRDFRFVRGGWSVEEDNGILIDLEQKFSDNLVFRIGYYLTERREESRNVNFNLTTVGSVADFSNPPDTARELNIKAEYGWLFDPGHPRFDEWSDYDINARNPIVPEVDQGPLDAQRVFQYDWGGSRGYTRTDQWRAEFVFQKDILGALNRFLVGMTYFDRKGYTVGVDLYDTDLGRNFFSSTPGNFNRLPTAFPHFKSVYDQTPIDPIIREGEVWRLTGPEVYRQKFWEKGYYLIHQLKLFDDKLRTVTGIRYDWVHTANQGVDDTTFEPEGWRHRATGPTDDWNGNFGVNWQTPWEPLAVYYLTASALTPIYNQTLTDGLIPPPVQGQSQEFGLKFDFFDQKISGYMALYNIDRQGVVISGTVEPVPDIDQNSDAWEEQGRGNSGTNLLKDDRSRGLDIQIFFTDIIMEGLQNIVSLSYNDYLWKRSYTPVSYDGRSGDEFLFSFEDFSDTIPRDRLNNDTPEYTVKTSAKYRFQEGPLDGLELFLGTSWQSEREAQYSFTEPQSYRLIPQRFTMDGNVRYKTEIGDSMDLTLQVNVFNLLNDTKFAGYGGPTAPRRWRVTARASF